jgi:hypothetical protein
VHERSDLDKIRHGSSPGETWAQSGTQRIWRELRG